MVGDIVSTNIESADRSDGTTYNFTPYSFSTVILNVACFSVLLLETVMLAFRLFAEVVIVGDNVSLKISTSYDVMVSFIVNRTVILSPALAYKLFSLVLWIESACIAIGGGVFTMTLRVMIGPGLPA